MSGGESGETVFDPRSGDIIVQVPPLSEEKLYPKEKALVDLMAAERMEGRRVLVYATHTGTRDITERMDDILTRHGLRVAVMKADAVAPERREAWVAEKVKPGHRRDDLPPAPRADRPRPDRLPDLGLVRDRVLCPPIDTKKYGSHGQSILMQLELNRYNKLRSSGASHLWWVEEQVCPPPYGFKRFSGGPRSPVGQAGVWGPDCRRLPA